MPRFQGATKEAGQAIQGITVTIEEVSAIAATIASSIRGNRASKLALNRAQRQPDGTGDAGW